MGERAAAREHGRGGGEEGKNGESAIHDGAARRGREGAGSGPIDRVDPGSCRAATYRCTDEPSTVWSQRK
ncbi:hypothetical protein rosag_44400 [Roseisolibacter agri]|uniref:Uncharacterized protein n=1 Tax=Roseisolibacter agri TaxID=2014610 RepID=A0AA37V4G7_9BACT|nr:hypothetical protein rosag_44400 [Roseisolibacter agri]